MARIDRIFARRNGHARKVNNLQKLRPVFDQLARKVEYKAVPYHVPGAQWWLAKLPDIAERNLKSETTRRGAFKAREAKLALVTAKEST